MASSVDLSAGPASMDQPPVPYSPAWIDRLLDSIERLPIPAWLFYPLLLVFIYLFVNVARWLEGTAPFGTFDGPYSFVVVYPVCTLAAIHYLDRTAARAFDFFRPALGKSEAEAACLRYELTHLRPRPALLAAAAGSVFCVLSVNLAPSTRPQIGSGLYYWSLIGIAMVGLIFTAELLYHTVRQLRLVTRIHASAARVDLFNFAPLYSFSALTARTGMVFVLLLWIDLYVNQETLVNASLIALNATIALLSVACFLLPLYGMHQRIITEKRRLELEVNQHLTAVVQTLYGRVDERDLHDADAVNKTVSSLLLTREVINKIPAWPWRPETFTAFFTALTLPVIVFLIQMTLKTLIGFK